MWRHALRLADDPRRVIMTVHCIDGGDGAPYADLFKSLEGVIVVRTAVPSNLGFDGTSLAHARCVQDALSMTRDGSIHVISDSDAFVVMRRWDEYVRARLDHDDGIGMLGTTYEPMDGWSSGSENVQTYKGAPSLTWCALNPRHDWSKLDVSPCKGRYPVTIGTDEQSGIYGLPVGVNVLGEVGWRIPQFLHDEDVTYHGMKHLKGSRDAKVLKGLSDYHEEYVVELEGIEVPFIAHHRGSLRHPFKASEMSAAFFNRIEGWIESQCLFQHT
jgi:hypothetical protein